MALGKLTVLISSDKIQERIKELGARIDAEYPNHEETVHLIAILKGAYVFMADLSRAIKRPVTVDFMGISSYGKGKTSSGEVRVTKDLDTVIEGNHVIIVEDIVDSGVTLTYLLNLLDQRKPKSIKIAALLAPGGATIRTVKNTVNIVIGKNHHQFISIIGVCGNARNISQSMGSVYSFKSWNKSVIILYHINIINRFKKTLFMIPKKTFIQNNLITKL